MVENSTAALSLMAEFTIEGDHSKLESLQGVASINSGIARGIPKCDFVLTLPRVMRSIRLRSAEPCDNINYATLDAEFHAAFGNCVHAECHLTVELSGAHAGV